MIPLNQLLLAFKNITSGQDVKIHTLVHHPTQWLSPVGSRHNMGNSPVDPQI